MSKYIIEIEEKPLCVFDKDTQTYFPRLWRVKGFNSLVLDEEGLSRLEELNSDYINEHYGDLQDEAYKRGINDGSLDVKQRVEGAYQKGFEDGKKEAESSEHIKSITADAFNKGMLFKEEKINDAFKRGLEEGKKATWGLVADASSAEYQRGLDDAWEAARKIAYMWNDIDDDELLAIFGITERIDYSTINTLFGKQTASEAIEKLKAYEEKQKADNDKFEFGDEIIDSNGVKGCVISMNNEKSNIMYALFGGYRVPQCICQKNYRKTGKHYDVDDIKKLLEEMRHD